MPIRIVANGVVTRSVRDTAAFYREAERIWPATPSCRRSATSNTPGKQRLRIAVITHSLLRESSPEVRELTLKSAGLLEELGHRVDHRRKAAGTKQFRGRFRAVLGPVGDGADSAEQANLRWRSTAPGWTICRWGLDRHARRNLHRFRWRSMRLSRTRRYTQRLARSYDVVLTPTLADEPPQIGYLDPMADYQQIIDRLQDWVAFTPLHNVTGEPAISLPLAVSANGLPVGHDVLRGAGSRSSVAGTGVRTRRRPTVGAHRRRYDLVGSQRRQHPLELALLRRR